MPREVELGTPLPAHSIVINPGSGYFSAQAERWTEQAAPGAKPILRVPLDSAHDLPHALAAIRYIYTGELSISRAAELLHVRRLAAYLQVEGCVEACDKALLALPGAQPTEGGAGPAAVNPSPLAGVANLYACRELLPGADDDPGAAALLNGLYDACRKQLLAHSAVGPVPPDYGELLGWSFRDAPSLLSDPGLKTRMTALPAAAMEALLSSECFATDNEASVLLMLAEWLQVNPHVGVDARERLCKLIRLSKLSSAYLYSILPGLSWFPLTPQQHQSLCQYLASDPEERAQLVHEWRRFGTRLDGGSPWFAALARPRACSDTGRLYDWSTDAGDFVQWRLAGAARTGVFGCSFGLVANGFSWEPSVAYDPRKDALSIRLTCVVPAALRLGNADRITCTAASGPLRLTLHRWLEDGSCKRAYKRLYGSEVTTISTVRCKVLRRPSTQAADEAGAAFSNPLGVWATYAKGGQMGGTITRMALP